MAGIEEVLRRRRLSKAFYVLSPSDEELRRQSKELPHDTSAPLAGLQVGDNSPELQSSYLQIKQAHQSFFVLAGSSWSVCPSEDEEYYSEGHARNVSRGEFNSSERSTSRQEYGYYSEGNVARCKRRHASTQSYDHASSRQRHRSQDDFDSDGLGYSDGESEGRLGRSEGNIAGPRRVSSQLMQHIEQQRRGEAWCQGGHRDDFHSEGCAYNSDGSRGRLPGIRVGPMEANDSEGKVPRRQRRLSRQERRERRAMTKQQHYRERGGYDSDESMSEEEGVKWHQRPGRKVSEGRRSSAIYISSCSGHFRRPGLQQVADQKEVDSGQGIYDYEFGAKN
jgi:hypothetical protein